MTTTKTKTPRPGRITGLSPLSNTSATTAFKGAPPAVASDKPLAPNGEKLDPKDAHLNARSVS